MVIIKTLIQKKFKYFSFIISMIIFISIFSLTYLDIKTYNHSNFTNWWIKLKYMMNWFSCWDLFYCALISFILIFFEIFYLRKINNKKSIIIYNFLKSSAGTYCFFVFMIYNALYIFDPIMITDDAHSLQSKIEHIIVPILFNIYLLISIKKDLYKQLTLKDFFIKIIPLTFIYPIIYIIYCAILGFKVKFYPYFIFDINKIGVEKFVLFMLLIFFFNFTIATLYNIPTVLKISYFNNKKINNLERYKHNYHSD